MPIHTRPAPLGFACGEYHQNPQWQPGLHVPSLIQCTNRASHRMVLVNSGDPAAKTVKRCAACVEVLRRKVASGATFEIIADEQFNYKGAKKWTE